MQGVLQLRPADVAGSTLPPFFTPALGIALPMWSHKLRKVSVSLFGMLSATGMRGSLTIPLSIASISEKSLQVQGNSVPSV